MKRSYRLGFARSGCMLPIALALIAPAPLRSQPGSTGTPANAGGKAGANVTQPPAGLDIVTLTLPAAVGAPILDKHFPFDEAFTLSIAKAPTEYVAVVVRLRSVRSSKEPTPDCKDTAGWEQNLDASGNAKDGFYAVVHPLPVDRYVRGCLFVRRTPNASDKAALTEKIAAQLLVALPRIGEMSAQGYTAAIAHEMQRLLLQAAAEVPGVDSVVPLRSSALDRTLAANEPEAIIQRQRLSQVISTAIDPVVDATANLGDARAGLRALRDSMQVEHALRLLVLSPVPTPPAAGQVTRDTSLVAKRLALLDSIYQDATWSRRFEQGELVLEERARSRVPPLGSSPSIEEATLALANARKTELWLRELVALLDYAEAAITTRAGGTAPPVKAMIARAKSLANVQTMIVLAHEDLVNALQTRSAAVDNLAKELTVIVSESVEFFGSTIASFATRAAARITVDLGATTAWRVERVVPTIGLNIYFVPVNKRVPMALDPTRGLRGIVRRLSIGVALTTVSAGISEREDVFSGKSPVVSVGYRLWDFFRISAGAMPLRAPARGTFSSGKRWTVEPVATLSIDDEVREVVKDFVGLVWPGKQ